MTTNTNRSEAHQPTTDIVRARYHLATLPDDTPSEIIEMGRARSYAEFDRWLVQIRAEAKAEALEEAADELGGFDMAGMDEPVTAHEAAQWLRARVAQIKRTK